MDTAIDPSLFEASYHSISLNDTIPELFGTINIQKYISGWTGLNQAEYLKALSVVATALKLPGPSAVPIDFEYKDQKFHLPCIRRAYEGRAAPEEIRDATFLAYLTGLVPKPVGAVDYAQRWFGIDCNAFVGNYSGISPSTSIAAYARGYSELAMKPGNGATKDVVTSHGLLPIPPITDPGNIGAGTLLLTFGEPDTHGNPWRHIALVQGCWVQSKTATQAVVMLSLCEWGGTGGPKLHNVPATPTKLDLAFKCSDLKNTTCIAYDGSAPDGTPAKRIFFDSTKFDMFDVRGRHVYDGSGMKTFNT